MKIMISTTTYSQYNSLSGSNIFDGRFSKMLLNDNIFSFLVFLNSFGAKYKDDASKSLYNYIYIQYIKQQRMN